MRKELTCNVHFHNIFWGFRAFGGQNPRSKSLIFGFAREILDQSGFEDIGIDPVPTSAFKTPAPRPAFSVLDCSWAESKGIVMPTWDDALTRYLVSSDRPEVLADWESSIESTPFPNTSPREASR